MITKKQAEKLITDNYRNIYNFCCAYIGNKDDVLDVTQNVFLTFLEKAEQLDNKNIRSWLYSTALNKIKEYRYYEKRRSKIYTIDEIYASTEEIPETVLDLEIIDNPDLIEYTKIKLLSKLTPEERRLLMDIYEKRMKFSEIGKEIGISENAVIMRNFRLRKKIEKLAKNAFIILLMVLIKCNIL